MKFLRVQFTGSRCFAEFKFRTSSPKAGVKTRLTWRAYLLKHRAFEPGTGFCKPINKKENYV